MSLLCLFMYSSLLKNKEGKGKNGCSGRVGFKNVVILH